MTIIQEAKRAAWNLDFVIRISLVIRHSDFVIPITLYAHRPG